MTSLAPRFDAIRVTLDDVCSKSISIIEIDFITTPVVNFKINILRVYHIQLLVHM